MIARASAQSKDIRVLFVCPGICPADKRKRAALRPKIIPVRSVVFRNAFCYMSGMAGGSVEKVKTAGRQEVLSLDIYRRGPSSEVLRKVSLAICSMPVPAFVLPAAGWRNSSGNVNNVGSNGNYWSSTPNDSENAWSLNFNSNDVNMNWNNRSNGQSVRLVLAFAE